MKWAVVPAAGRLSVAGGSVYGSVYRSPQALSVRYRGGRIAVEQVQVEPGDPAGRITERLSRGDAV